jgi:hypothetical protein
MIESILASIADGNILVAAGDHGLLAVAVLHTVI